MTGEELKGRRITALVSAWLLLPSVAPLVTAVATGGRVPAWTWFVFLVLPAALCWFLLQGRTWARYLAVGLLNLGSAGLIVRVIVEGGSRKTQLMMLGAAVVYMLAGSTLWASKLVEAFFQRSRD